MDSGRRGLTLIEILIVATIVSVLILAALFAYRTQLMKGRDAKRKADLVKLQNVLEDYLNDNVCYPDTFACGDDFAPYLHNVLCDPLNTVQYNYFYSYDGDESCKPWYKIYTKLEIEDDPVIEELGCSGGCGPSGNYNYWVSSANVAEVAQLPGEYWWLPIPGVTPPPGASPSPPPGGTPSPSPSPGASPSPGLSPSPTPTPISEWIPCGDNGYRPRCLIGGVPACVPGICRNCCPGVPWICGWADGGFCCLPDPISCPY